MRIFVARGPVRWFIKLRGFAGITLPPVGIFILAERFDDVRLRRHEAKHWQQYRQRGLIGWYVGYITLLIRHGYWNHPWEVEARRAERSE